MRWDPTGVIYGVRPVMEALRAIPERIEKIYVRAGRNVPEELHTLARQQNVEIVAVAEEIIIRLCRSMKHQGVAAHLSAGGQVPVTEVDDLIARTSHGPALWFVLDGIEDPRNCGAILRTADAVGANGVIMPNRRAVGLTATVAKTSAGALLHLPVCQVINLSMAIDRLKAAEVWIVGLSEQATTCYWDFDFRTPVALVLGREGGGLHNKVRRRCDAEVRVPMQGHVGSLNVSVAAALVAYEAMRQRRGTPSET